MKPALYACLLMLAVPACKNVGGGGGPPAKLETEDQKTLYAIGLMMGRNIATFNLTPVELDIVKQGMTDQATGKKPAIDPNAYMMKVGEMARKRSAARADIEKNKGKAFEETAAKEAGAERTPSGLVFKTIKAGNGPSPKPTDTVKVDYRGTLIDGVEFDSSASHGQPAEFPLNGVIPCWTEGVQKMKVGEKARLVCPSSIAYGDMGRQPKIPGGATLVFEVELLSISPPKAPPAIPGGVSVPPPALPGGHPALPPAGAKPATPPAKTK